MKTLFKAVVFFLICNFFNVAFTQVRDGQVISKGLALGEGRSVPLPPGKWTVKIQTLPATNASSIGYLLENSDNQSDIVYIFVNETKLFVQNWNPSVYVPVGNSFMHEYYGTSTSSIETKFSSVSAMNSKAVTKFFENLKFEVDQNKLKGNQFLLLDARIINPKNRIRYVSIARTSTQFDSSLAVEGNENYELLKAWNRSTVGAIVNAYNNKIPSSINHLSIASQLAETTPDLKITELTQAQAQAQAQQRLALGNYKKALVVGNNSYTHVSPLLMAVSDSEAISTKLSNLGYKVTLVKNGNRNQMLSTVRQFKQTLSSSDEVILYYAGHGVQIGQSNYLLPTDILGDSEDQIKDDAIALDRILEDFDEKGVKFTLAIIDACRDNPFKSQAKRSIGTTRGLAPANTANGQIIIFSAGTGQSALDNLGPSDEDKNSVFTRVLLREMNNNEESIDRMIRNVRKRVVELAKSVGHTQVPAIYDQAIGEFYFSK
jgi:hypothetical protein